MRTFRTHICRIIVSAVAVWPLAAQIEPDAGAWRTWVLARGAEIRLPPPPGTAETAAEIASLKAYIADTQASPERMKRVRYWNSGSPSYRWVEIALNQIQTKGLSNPRNARALALMNIAIYDAMVSAWGSKYEFNRPRPAQVDGSVPVSIDTPKSPSYPSELAVAAGAASVVLAYAWPADAQSFRDLAVEAGLASVGAGINYPSDFDHGMLLGRAVAARVIAWADSDGSQLAWTGSVPTTPGLWNGTNPLEPLAGTWKTWVLRSGDQLRPGPPLAYNSSEKRSELNEIKSLTRSFAMNQKAFYYQAVEGIFTNWYQTLSQRLFESRLDENAPRAARAYTLASIAHHDASVACWDGKYAYWAIRPFQLDSTVTTLFPSPNHPSYPAAHGCYSGAIARVIGQLFPDFADTMEARSTEAAESRIWAGIHYRSDVNAGLTIGRKVGDLVMERAARDGSASR
jgi:membrane-associated phospholipid phosphatase